MKIEILSIGKNKKSSLLDAEAEFLKRLQPSARLSLKELPQQRGSDPHLVKAAEGKTILSALGKADRVIALQEEGKAFSSAEFAQKIESEKLAGFSSLTFVIGGAFGLAPEVSQRADWTLSLSPLTFPHELCRLLLLEQLYRAFSITSGSPYHKA